MAIKSRAQRMTIRNRLRKHHGDRCVWCGGIMTFHPDIRDPEEMATIEHWRAKRKGLNHAITHLDLAHKRCNR